MRDIGKNIRDLRERSNLTQEELAGKLYVTRQTISNYENGRSRPDIDMILKIAETLKVDANALLYGIPVSEDKKKANRKLAIAAAVFLLWQLQVFRFILCVIPCSQRNMLWDRNYC